MMKGDLLNENQSFGSIWYAILLFITSLIFFINGAVPYKSMISDDKKIKISYYLSITCLILSALELPLWIIISGQFPPSKFSDLQVVIIAITIIFSIFGPASPWIILYRRHLIEIKNKKREEKIKTKR